MKRKDRAPRELALVLGFSLIWTSFGPEAWAAGVPLVDRAPVPVDAISAAADSMNVPAGLIQATVGPAGALTTTPFDPLLELPARETDAAHETAAAEAAPASPVSRPAAGTKLKSSSFEWAARKDALLSEAQEIKDRLDGDSRRSELEAGPELGRAEKTLIDDRPIVRVVHASTGMSFLFLDADSVSRDSKHLRQFVARQFFDAGSDRKDGRRGRDTVVVWQKGGKTIEAEFHQKPAFPSRDWWRQYWRATYKAPTWESLKFGLFWGSVQGLLAWGVAGLNHWLTGTPVNLAPLALAFGSGTLVPTFISTYKNWTYRGTLLSQTAKLAFISLVLAYSAVILTKGFLALTLAGNLLILFNVCLKSTTKAPWQAIPKMFEKYQREKAMRPLFWGFKTGDTLNQGLYQIGAALRLLALLVPAGMEYAAVVMGYVPLAVGMAVAMWASYLYARRHNYPEADQMFQTPRRALQWLRNALRGPSL